MIEINSLFKKFSKLEVLNDINLSLKPGQCIALIGPNGCGKSTLIKSILGMVIPDKGDILVNGKNIKTHFQYRENIGYMPQIGRYPDNMSIHQVIQMVKDIRKSSNPLDEYLLNQYLHESMYAKEMRTLSGGTTQKVSACLAFLFNPPILILDEPTAGLDPIASEVLKEKISLEKEKGKLILITSHLLSELDDVISHIIFMNEAKILFYKSKNELLTSTGEERTSKAIYQILKNQHHD